MAETRHDILIKSIYKAVGLENFEKQEKLLTGLNRATQKVQRSFSEIEGNFKKVTTVTAGFNKDGKKVVTTNEKLYDITQQLAEKDFLAEWSKKLGVNTSRVRQAMSYAGITIDKAGQSVDLAGRPIKNLEELMRRGEIKTRKFNMSLLSVMFAGMALKRSMGGLLKPAAEATGLFDTFSDVLITTFEPIMEAITPLFEWLSDVMDRLGDTTKIIIGGIVLFLFVGGAMLALGGQLGLAYGGLSVQIATLTVALHSATAAFAGTGTAAIVAGTKAQVGFAPFLPILYAIAAVVFAVILIYYKWEDITEALGERTKGLGKTSRMVITSIALFWGWLGDRISTFWDIIVEIFTSIGEFLTNIWEGITGWLSETWDSIVEYFKTKWQGLKDWFINLWTILKDWFWGILSAIWGIFVSIWNTLKNWFWTILTTIWNFFVSVWNGLYSWFSSILKSIWSFFVSIWNSIFTFFSTILTNIKNWFIEKWNSIKAWFYEHLLSHAEMVRNIWNTIANWLSEKIDAIKNFFKEKWEALKEISRDVWEGIKNTVKNAVNGILDFINTLINAWNRLHFTVPTVRVGKYTFGGWEVGVPTIPPIPLLQEGGFIRKPTLAMLGERGPEAVVPLREGYGETIINFSPTYNITVSDKADFERMIRFNNTKLVEDLRRISSL